MGTKKAVAIEPDAAAIEQGSVKKLIIKNFRAIGETPVTIDLDKIVVLVGPNNVGKSSILRAYEAVMQDGSTAGHLHDSDFPNGRLDPEKLTTIELHTTVKGNPPANKWVATIDGEFIVRERWTWASAGAGKRQGWNNEINDWDPKEVPWGAPNVANARRPQPYWVKAFDSPEEQVDKINKLITTMITDRAKLIPSEGDPAVTEFSRLLQLLQDFQAKAFDQTKADVAEIEKRLTGMVAGIFADHVISFSVHPPVDKDIKIFSGSSMAVGRQDGYKGPLENQGSGARRTVLWAVLRVLSEQATKTSERPRVLLIDEPELCLHPDAVREACRVLYDLADKAGWQVIVTTHSPVFIDLGRDNTTVVRVARTLAGDIAGTTLFKPENVKLGKEDKENLHLLNIYDPYVAEFFFGGRVIVVEGDTEYSAFRYVVSEIVEGRVAGTGKDAVSDIHIVRARGKATIVSLCKILNHFGTPYCVLHDSDTPVVYAKDGAVKKNKDGAEKKNPAWAVNQNILDAVKTHTFPDQIRVLASRKNFESAFLGDEVHSDKPYNAISELKTSPDKMKVVIELLLALLDPKKPIPSGALDAKNLKDTDLAAAA